MKLRAFVLILIASSFLGCRQQVPAEDEAQLGESGGGVAPTRAVAPANGVETEGPAESPAGAASGFVDGVDHLYFPLEPGTVRIYDGDDEGAPRIEKSRVLRETTEVGGVACTALVDNVHVDGVLVEVTTQWFAQDGEGNVWKFGEESIQFEDGLGIRSADSWEAGVDGAIAWIAFPAQPAVGEVFQGYSPEAPDQFRIVSLNATANVPAGNFVNCLEIEEKADEPDDTDRVIYGPGTGMVSETSPTGSIRLISLAAE